MTVTVLCGIFYPLKFRSLENWYSFDRCMWETYGNVIIRQILVKCLVSNHILGRLYVCSIMNKRAGLCVPIRNPPECPPPRADTPADKLRFQNMLL